MPRAATPKTAAQTCVSAALECFARGFSFTRSFTYPCEASRVADTWVLRDVPRKNPRDYRGEEWVASTLRPAELLALARAGTRGRYALCHVVPSEAIGDELALRAEYKRLGCRLHTTEPLMVHDLRKIPRSVCDYPIARVTTAEQADALARANNNRRFLLPEHLAPGASLRAYIATDPEGQPVGWVRSIVTGAQDSWVASLYVDPAHRRRGIGRALLARMLRDDRAAGAARSTLLASHAGALLYPTVGYRQIGTLFLYTPPRR